MLKSNKGVTLVALVITIIVLLILAGVSISLVVGDNGVLSNATTAVDNTSLASVQSEVELAIESCQTDFYAAYVEDNSANFTDYLTHTNLQDYMSSGYTLGSSYSGSSVSGTVSFTAGSTTTIYVEYKSVVYTADIKVNSTDRSASCSDFVVAD